jgi:acylphosphatase
MHALVHRVYIIEGRVQGVGYRAHVHAFARRYPIAGSVQNLPDGDVRVEVQGSEDVVDQFMADILQPHWPIHPRSVRFRRELPTDPTLREFLIARSSA